MGDNGVLARIFYVTALHGLALLLPRQRACSIVKLVDSDLNTRSPNLTDRTDTRAGICTQNRV